jgi:hypothetical protein
MKVKIIKSSIESYWYNDLIGEIYEVYEFGSEYVVKESVKNKTMIWLVISKNDCEILK